MNRLDTSSVADSISENGNKKYLKFQEETF